MLRVTYTKFIEMNIVSLSYFLLFLESFHNTRHQDPPPPPLPFMPRLLFICPLEHLPVLAWYQRLVLLQLVSLPGAVLLEVGLWVSGNLKFRSLNNKMLINLSIEVMSELRHWSAFLSILDCVVREFSGFMRYFLYILFSSRSSHPSVRSSKLKSLFVIFSWRRWKELKGR